MRRNTILILFCIILLLIITACSQKNEPTTTEKEIVEVSYQQKINDFNFKLDSIFEEFNLTELETINSNIIDKERTLGDYHFTWTHENRKLRVPLFGEKVELLSNLKDKLIPRLNEEFSEVKITWKDKEKEEALFLEIFFKSDKEDLKIITHNIELVQDKPKAKLAIVIDDFGFNRKGTEEILSIKRPLTMALLPFRPQTQKDAKLIKDAGQELILHQPLEPTNPNANPGDGAIYTNMSSKEIRDILEKNLSSLTGILGVNHHMGSKASADKRVMQEIMNVLKGKDLFYIDSSTAHNSVAGQTAVKNGVPTVLNYLFIDNIDEKDEVKKMIMHLAKVSLKKKELLIIGHVRINTALAIQESIPEIEKMGIKLVYASELVD